MKLKAFVVIGSLAFVPATHSAAESWGDPSAAAGFGDLTLDAAPAEAQATPQAITPSTEAPTAFTPAAAAPVPAGLGTVKLEEENGGAPAKGHSLTPVAEENIKKINDGVREINTEQQALYQKIMGVDAELDTFFATFSKRRGMLAGVASTVDDYLTSQDASSDKAKGSTPAHEKRQALLTQAVKDLAEFREALKDLSLQDKVLDQQEDELRTYLTKSLEDLNAAIKVAADAQKSRNDVFEAASDDVAHAGEVAIGAAWAKIDETIKKFKDGMLKEIDTKAQAIRDAVKKLNDALEVAQKKGEGLKGLIKDLGVQDALIATSEERSVVVEVSKGLAHDEAKKKEYGGSKPVVVAADWLGWAREKAHNAKEYAMSFFTKKTEPVPAAPVVAAAPAQGQAPVPVPTPAPAVAPAVVPVPAAVVPPVTGASPVVPSLSPSQNPARAEDVKQVQTVGKVLGKSVGRVWNAVSSFFKDLKEGLFEPTDNSSEDVRPVAAKTVTLPTAQQSAEPVPAAPVAPAPAAS